MHFIFFLHFIPFSCININKENIPPTTERTVQMGYSFFMYLMKEEILCLI